VHRTQASIPQADRGKAATKVSRKVLKSSPWARHFTWPYRSGRLFWIAFLQSTEQLHGCERVFQQPPLSSTLIQQWGFSNAQIC
jgi:hypothetical protein